MSGSWGNSFVIRSPLETKAPLASGVCSRASGVGTVDTAQRLSHKIEFRDEATPAFRTKPDGVVGCKRYIFIGTTSPTGPDAMHLQAVDKSTPCLMEFDGADVGKTAFWALRWVKSRGEHGLWSANVSGTNSG